MKSNMNLYKFKVIQAEISMTLSILNVTIMFTFNIQCKLNCQQTGIYNLKTINLNNVNPIYMIYDGSIHFHNVTLFGK